MKVTLIPIVTGAPGTNPKGLVRELEDIEIGGHRPEYKEKFWRLEETCCHSNSSEKPSAKPDVKKF